MWQDFREFFRVIGYAMMGLILPLAIISILYGMVKLIIWLTGAYGTP